MTFQIFKKYFYKYIFQIIKLLNKFNIIKIKNEL